MSMIMKLFALRDEDLRRIVVDPGLALSVVNPYDYPAESNGVTVADQQCEDLHKAWHGIHYLLTQTAEEGEPPLNALLLGGQELADADDFWGYGAPRVLTAAETRAFADALRMLTDVQLADRFNPADMLMLGIYPDVWDDEDGVGFLLPYLLALREFLEAAVAQQRGMLIAIT